MKNQYLKRVRVGRGIPCKMQVILPSKEEFEKAYAKHYGLNELGYSYHKDYVDEAYSFLKTIINSKDDSSRQTIFYWLRMLKFVEPDTSL